MTDTTTTAPKKAAPRGRKPEDHQQKAGTAADAVEREQILAELLGELPALPGANELRISERGRIRSIMIRAEKTGIFETATIEVDADSDDEAMIEKIEALDKLCAQIDDWAESIAPDPAAYIRWSRGKGYDHFFAILDRYQSAVGESTGS
jgi:hypothetical protein